MERDMAGQFTRYVVVYHARRRGACPFESRLRARVHNERLNENFTGERL